MFPGKHLKFIILITITKQSSFNGYFKSKPKAKLKFRVKVEVCHVQKLTGVTDRVSKLNVCGSADKLILTSLNGG